MASAAACRAAPVGSLAAAAAALAFSAFIRLERRLRFAEALSLELVVDEAGEPFGGEGDGDSRESSIASALSSRISTGGLSLVTDPWERSSMERLLMPPLIVLVPDAADDPRGVAVVPSSSCRDAGVAGPDLASSEKSEREGRLLLPFVVVEVGETIQVLLQVLHRVTDGNFCAPWSPVTEVPTRPP
jgi:hypothetical protein